MSIVNSLLKVFLGDKSGKDLKKITPLVDDINNHFVKMSSLSNDQLRNKTIEFKKSISNQTSDINQSIGELNIKISAQSHLKSFYQQQGFTKKGDDYLEDEIPHCAMILSANG